jgi:hypothetical protein
MRPIKFRAYDALKKEMLQINPYDWVQMHTVEGDVQAFDNLYDLSNPNYCNRVSGKSVFLTLDGSIISLQPLRDNATRSINETNRYELMQFTGLTDKNGKEIYEGDVVKVTDLNAEETKNIVIEYKRGGYCIEWDGRFYDSSDVTLIAWAMEDEFEFEVIGNIYENPELLTTN